MVVNCANVNTLFRITEYFLEILKIMNSVSNF